MQQKHTLKITVIDDDAMMRTMLVDFIRNKYPNAEIASWPSGEEALANISFQQDLVILDFHLDSAGGGILNGIEIFKKLRERFSNMPVIFISGQDESKVAASILMHGANDYIVKNENVFERLDKVLISVLGKSGTQKTTPKKQMIIFLIILYSILYHLKNV